MKTKRLLKTIILGLVVCLLVLTLAVPTFAEGSEDNSRNYYMTNFPILISNFDGGLLNDNLYSINTSDYMNYSYGFAIQTTDIDYYTMTLSCPAAWIYGSYDGIPTLTLNNGYTASIEVSFKYVEPINRDPIHVEPLSLSNTTTSDFSHISSDVRIVNASYSHSYTDTVPLVDFREIDFAFDRGYVLNYTATLFITNNSTDTYFSPFDVDYVLRNEARYLADYTDLITYVGNTFYDNGYSSGITASSSDVYDDGYRVGFEAGVNSTNIDLSTWLVTAVGGFLDFELFPGFSFAGILGILISIGLVLLFLKFFAGG